MLTCEHSRRERDREIKGSSAKLLPSLKALHFIYIYIYIYIYTPPLPIIQVMSKKRLAILLRSRMRPNNNNPTKTSLSLSRLNTKISQEGGNNNGPSLEGTDGVVSSRDNDRVYDLVKESMHAAIMMNKMEALDASLNDFSEGYCSLSHENRRNLLVTLAREYDLDRSRVRDLTTQYLGLDLLEGEEDIPNSTAEEGMNSVFYRIERNLRHALQPKYEVLFDRLNMHPGGLKVLSILRADILSILAEKNIVSLRALDGYLKEKLSTWLSPAALGLHQITWDDAASLLEKIVAYEAVHPISNLLDLKRRLGIGRRCFGYFHPAIPGEPLIFIEVALLRHVAETIQEVLWDDPPIPEHGATCALFYSISSTQPGLSGINLGKFLIKRVITLVKKDMPRISTFATLSPIPGFMQWLLSKLASQAALTDTDTVDPSASQCGSSFCEDILEPEEEENLLNVSGENTSGKNGTEVMLNLLTSANNEWINSPELVSALKPPLMRLCTRYLVQEKKRGKALNSVANFHLQNGAMVERINWMADQSEKGLHQSAGIMVNYVYRLENIEEYAQSYFNTGHINVSRDVLHYVERGEREKSQG